MATLSSEFYTVIPHNFGMKNMSNFIIKTRESLKEKMDLVSNLGDIHIAHNLIKGKAKSKAAKPVNPIDEKYDTLNCKIEALK